VSGLTPSHNSKLTTDGRAEFVRWVAESSRPFEIVQDTRTHWYPWVYGYGYMAGAGAGRAPDTCGFTRANA
jgi:hypothetical protein